MKGMASSRHASVQVVDIVRDTAQVPPPVGNRPPTTLKVELTAVEVVGELDPATGTTYRYWTFNGKVPAPMIRVRQGDMVQVALHNNPSSHMVHSVDFHAAIGPGGGAALSQVLPGQEKTFTFEATTPGLFVYHCGAPMIADHIANGMYGLILVEPPGGLPHVDHEYYAMQGEIYTTAAKGKTGMQSFSEAKLVQELPEYFVFNGAVDALTKKYPLHANTGETVRIFFGDAGPNKTSSLHVVGEIFNRDYQLGSLTSPPLNGIQTANVPPGGAAILELKVAMPGQFNFMDHAMARMAKGVMGTLEVRGETTAELMHAGPASAVTDVRRTAGTGPTPMAEIIAKNDMDAASPTLAASGPSGSDNENRHIKMNMNHAANAASTAAVAGSNVRDTGGRLQGPGAAQLDGCLTFAGPLGIPKLTLFRSQKSYELEPRSGC
jgi:nitrite reductase (NO-forming)